MRKFSIVMLLLAQISLSQAADKRTGKPIAPAEKKVIALSVTDKGFEPDSIDVTPGSSVVLKVTRKTDSTCAKAIQVPAKNIKTELPLNKTITVDLGVLEKGEIKFGCAMEMMLGGIIHVK